jgi:hypothetical protein
VLSQSIQVRILPLRSVFRLGTALVVPTKDKDRLVNLAIRIYAIGVIASLIALIVLV